MNIDDIRALVRANPRATDGYPEQVREVVGRYGRRRRDEGARWADIEAEVGVSRTSIRSWMRALLVGFHQVAIVDEPSVVEVMPQAFVITSPSGFALTGCTLEQAAAVMQRLR